MSERLATISQFLKVIFGFFILIFNYLRNLVRKPFCNTGKPVFICFSAVKWDGAWQRPQHLAFNISSDFLVVYFDPLPLHHIEYKISQLLQSPFSHPKDIKPNLKLFRPLTLPGEFRSKAIRVINRLLIMGYLKNFFINQFWVYLNNPIHYEYLRKMKIDDHIVYDIIDDFTVTGWAPNESSVVERELLHKAKLVISGTFSLKERKSKYREDIHFIRCGVDFELFNNPKGEIPIDMKGLNQPMILYFGVLNERINGEILEAIAREFPEGSLVLIGPVHKDFPFANFPSPLQTVVNFPSKAFLKLPKGINNIFFLGTKPYHQLPAYLSYAQIAIMPYKLNPITEIINPVKALEYLAGGKPVVATPIPDLLRFYGDIIYFADTPDEFAAKCRKAIENPDNRRIKAGIEISKIRSWKAMAEEFNQLLKEII